MSSKVIVPPSYESPIASQDKRFKARHYAYRDFTSATTSATPVSYTVGTTARAVNARNWPMLGDTRLSTEIPAQNTYARSIMVQCTQDAWIIISSVNPRYIRLYVRYLAEGLTVAQAVARLSGQSIALTITETPMFIPQDAILTFRPTLGAAVTYYMNAVAGTIRLWIEGNTEGSE